MKILVCIVTEKIGVTYLAWFSLLGLFFFFFKVTPPASKFLLEHQNKIEFQWKLNNLLDYAAPRDS